MRRSSRCRGKMIALVGAFVLLAGAAAQAGTQREIASISAKLTNAKAIRASSAIIAGDLADLTWWASMYHDAQRLTAGGGRGYKRIAV